MLFILLCSEFISAAYESKVAIRPKRLIKLKLKNINPESPVLFFDFK